MTGKSSILDGIAACPQLLLSYSEQLVNTVELNFWFSGLACAVISRWTQMCL